MGSTGARAQIMLGNGYENDTAFIGVMNYDLGDDYTLVANSDGGTLTFQHVSVELKRTPSSREKPPIWTIVE